MNITIQDSKGQSSPSQMFIIFVVIQAKNQDTLIEQSVHDFSNLLTAYCYISRS